MAYRDTLEEYDGQVTGIRTKPVLVDNVDFNVYVEEGDIAEGKSVPPSRFGTRDKRFELLDNLWQGDFGKVGLGVNPVIINFFRSYSTKLANLLLMSEPLPGDQQVNDDGTTTQQAQPGERNVLADTAYDSLTDMTKYGGSVLLKLDGDVTTMNPKYWYPTEDGAHFFIRPFTVGDEAFHNRIELTYVDEAVATRAVHEYSGDRLGPPLNIKRYSDHGVEIVQLDPRNGIWGTSKYIDLYGAVIEICRRYSVNSRVLDLYGKPLAVFEDSERDAEDRFDVDSDDTADQAQRKILEGQVGTFENATIHLPDNLTGISFLQPDTSGTVNSIEQVESLTEVLREVSGLPNLQGQTLSGEALKRLFVFFYAETKAAQNSLRLALERIYGQRITWEHIFDTDLFSPKPLTEAQNEQDGDEDE